MIHSKNVDNPKENRVRVATLGDVEKITALINAAFYPAENFFVSGDRIDTESVRAFFTSGNFLLADEDGELLGCVYIEVQPSAEKSQPCRAYLGLLSVSPDLQNAGLGSLLMNAAEEYCAAKGARFMDIKVVNVRKELFSFYEKRGYKASGTSPFPKDVETHQPVHFVEMTKPLTR